MLPPFTFTSFSYADLFQKQANRFKNYRDFENTDKNKLSGKMQIWSAAEGPLLPATSAEENVLIFIKKELRQKTSDYYA